MSDFASRVAGEVATKQDEQSRFAALVAGETRNTRVSPDKDEARRIWRAMQEAALETGLTQPSWKWQTFADFWQFYVEDTTK